MHSLQSALALLLGYCLLSALPGLVLWLRGRGLRWRFILIAFLVSWTGGGWIIMTVIALMDKEGFREPLADSVPERRAKAEKPLPGPTAPRSRSAD